MLKTLAGLFDIDKRKSPYYKEKRQVPGYAEQPLCYGSPIGALNDKVAEIKDGKYDGKKRRDLYLLNNPRKYDSRIKIVSGDSSVNLALSQMDKHFDELEKIITMEQVAEVLYCASSKDIIELKPWLNFAMKVVDNSIYTSVEGKSLSSDKFVNYVARKNLFGSLQHYENVIERAADAEINGKPFDKSGFDSCMEN